MQLSSHPSRRAFLESLGGGFGLIGLAGMLCGRQAQAAVRAPHFAPKAKHVIFLFLTGGPSHIDLFDPKPLLARYAGQRPQTVDLRTERLTGGLLPSPWKFQPRGKSGVEVSELLPKLGESIDDICVLRSMYTFNPTHTPARNLMQSGNIAGHPAHAGAWISYGLGTENENLPGFVALSRRRPAAACGDPDFFRPSTRATHFNQSEVDPEKMIRYLRNNGSIPRRSARKST